jgi:hypothetical protein
MREFKLNEKGDLIVSDIVRQKRRRGVVVEDWNTPLDECALKLGNRRARLLLNSNVMSDGPEKPSERDVWGCEWGNFGECILPDVCDSSSNEEGCCVGPGFDLNIWEFDTFCGDYDFAYEPVMNNSLENDGGECPAIM